MERNLYTNFYKYLTVAILLIGFISGIGFGYAFSIENTIAAEFSWQEDEIEEKFNAIAMLITWISTLAVCIIPLSIYSICIRLEMIIDNTYPKRNNKNKDLEQEAETKNNNKRNTEKFIWE